MTEKKLPVRFSCSSVPADSFLPSTAVLEMTYACNHRCLFCSCPWESPEGSFTRKEELDTAEWKKLLALMCSMGVSNLAFTGGEPLLRKDLFELIRYSSRQEVRHIETVDGHLSYWFGPPKLYLLSNGTLVDDEVIDLCAELGINLSMSLPGFSTFSSHTGVDSSGKILDHFRTARKKGVATTVNITVTAENLHELEETISRALIAGADRLLMNRFLPGGRGLIHADRLLLSREQLIEMLDIAEKVLRLSGRFGNVGTELPRCIVESERYTNLSVGNRCSGAVKFFAIDPSGYIRPCNHSPIRLKHYSEIMELKKDPYWKAFAFKSYRPGMCVECEDIVLCDGGCREAAHIVSGSIDSPDPILARGS